MPLYDYKCPKCSSTEERLVKQEDKDSQTCSCGETMKRELSSHTKHGSWSQWQVGLNNRGR